MKKPDKLFARAIEQKSPDPDKYRRFIIFSVDIPGRGPFYMSTDFTHEILEEYSLEELAEDILWVEARTECPFVQRMGW